MLTLSKSIKNTAIKTLHSAAQYLLS